MKGLIQEKHNWSRNETRQKKQWRQQEEENKTRKEPTIQKREKSKERIKK